ncbi:MAG: OmpW family protein [Alphaproteobacteria bacterium]|nr:OmpW family protein [Alphaproteobacteria bacterium]
MKKILLATVCLASLSSIASPALAAEHFKEGDWMVRARALNVRPDVDSTLSIGGTVKIDNSVVPELDMTYFFTPNVSAELIAAVTPHKLTTSGGVDAGDVWLLPPTLTLQYHFDQFDSVIPYVGAGVNYTHFYGENAGALSSVDYDDSFGGALQVGADIPLEDNWYANVDVKKVFISTTANFSGAGGVRADVDIDPWIIGVGVGYKF